MNLKVFVTAFAAAAAISLMAAPADAATKKRAVRTSDGHTVFVSRDEDGRTRTKIIVQKRSYLSAGTEVMPGDRADYDYAMPMNHSASSVLDNTTFGGNRTALPDAFRLQSKNNPWLRF
jgi:hypothetical protein